MRQNLLDGLQSKSDSLRVLSSSSSVSKSLRCSCSGSSSLYEGEGTSVGVCDMAALGLKAELCATATTASVLLSNSRRSRSQETFWSMISSSAMSRRYASSAAARSSISAAERCFSSWSALSRLAISRNGRHRLHSHLGEPPRRREGHISMICRAAPLATGESSRQAASEASSPNELAEVDSEAAGDASPKVTAVFNMLSVAAA
mmetsp:Transcript_47356/g.138015  ORF Transcript_47356/g.138015 Transcript_47356/m.138015 type:complete len:204 (+) Transcript_47356:479-1090(+)